ncbi:auxin response factor 11 isoform X2 [Cryptomeria japonica]|uniref:auxin response factor 11 isoform X2 n=1 Tax=Cryptomeria japonica TaxID=3369 RepID=UPI0025ABDA11|nr:auxin response factor 11 isoform X2 [Cryptomeria japonica]
MEVVDLMSPNVLEPLAENGGNGETTVSTCPELWHACAGPLTLLPRKGSHVVYFPQGHMEQVAASLNQGANQQMPSYNIPPQIFCRVLSVKLHADQETDEVYAQLTLVPIPEPTEKCFEAEEEKEVHSSTACPHMFCKTLTVSDTSTHGGFSVPRRAAEDCFPPLDYSQQRPSQELVAKDLHGIEWKFRHIYRGQPRRHLLTTGWSVFVSHKRLVSGDAVLFLRGENGELRLGIRRTARQQSGIPSSVLSSQNMQLGLLAAAAHAVATKSMFHIFYNPRTSPAEFVIPYHKYVKSVSQSLSIGMQFKMRFETEDAAERRYTGVITGIGDIEPSRWPVSKWRSLKVEWDEHVANERKERVSPWEIEPFISAAGSNHLAGPRIKRLRTSLVSTPTDMSICDGGRVVDFGESVGFQKVLQGQELVPLRENLRDRFGSKNCQEREEPLCGSSMMAKTGSKSEAFERCHVPPSSELFSTNETFGKFRRSEVQRSVEHFALQCTDVNQQQPKFIMKLHERDNPSSIRSTTVNCGSTELGVSLSSFHSQRLNNTELQLVEMPLCFGTNSYYHGDLPTPYGHTFPFSHNSLQIGVPGTAARWQDPFVSPSGLDGGKSFPQVADILSSDISVGRSKSIPSEIPPCREDDLDAIKGKQKCKLFGFSLIEEPPCLGDVSSKISRDDTSNDLHGALVHRIQSSALGKLDELQKVSHEQCQQMITLECTDQEVNVQKAKQIQTPLQPSGRSCKKVHKQGNAVGRAVDLSKLHGYDELLNELEHLFNMEGALRDPKKGWQVVYTDNEGDMMLVGDDPWLEFCNIVCKILIYPVDDAQKMTQANFGNDALSCSEDQPATVEVSRCSIHRQDSSSRLTTGMP